MMLTAYFAIGFVLVVLEFVIVGPREMWRMLKDSDPNEPSFSLLKETTPERARRDEDNFGAWFCVLMTLFAWPVMLVVGVVFGVVHLAVFLAMKIAILLRKEVTIPEISLDKPSYCPHCGSERTVLTHPNPRYNPQANSQWYVRCDNCHACSSLHKNPKDAIYRWNRRRAPGGSGGLVGVTWSDICHKCEEGTIEPHFCPFYGEPNGCNAPHGIHPDAKAEESLIIEEGGDHVDA